VIPLRGIERKPGKETPAGFPFSLPLVRELPPLDLDGPVTFFVGENGSGKSTLLEGLAAAMGLPAIGGVDVLDDPTLVPARALGAHLRLVWNRRTSKGFFLRAEDFFNFARRVQATRSELDGLAEEYADQFTGYGKLLAVGAMRGQQRALEERYGEDLDHNSHGESFLLLFRERFVPGGVYLLDEPEAPLSPQRQLALLSMLKDMVRRDAQFVIATHSPILMAFPGARLYCFDGGLPRAAAWDELEHVTLTRDFLQHPERFLRHL